MSVLAIHADRHLARHVLTSCSAASTPLQDVARMVMAALRTDAAVGKTLPLAGPKAWSTAEVIELCERMADCDAEVRNVPVWLLKGTRGLLRSFQWASDAADRLAFAEVLSSNESFSADMSETYSVLGVDPASVTGLEDYLKVGECVGGVQQAAGRPAG